jgi:hypothetical protein
LDEDNLQASRFYGFNLGQNDRQVGGLGQQNAKDKNSFCFFLEANAVSGIDNPVINTL